MADGYVLPDVTGTLEFTDGYWRGADVEVRLTVALGVYFDILEAVDSGDAKLLREGLERWADEVLVAWNLLDRHGEPVPANAAGFLTLSFQAATELVRVWLNKVPDVELPSGGGLPGTATSGTRRARKPRPSS